MIHSQVPAEDAIDHLLLIGERLERDKTRSQVREEMAKVWPGVGKWPPVLVHGDFRLALSDWTAAGSGRPGVDVGYCRVELAILHGPQAAEDFLAAYREATGKQVEDLRFWDLAGADRAYPDPVVWLRGDAGLGRADLTPRLIRRRYDAFVAKVL